MSGGKRLVHFSPNVSYEQGFNVALNMQALVKILLSRESLLLM